MLISVVFDSLIYWFINLLINILLDFRSFAHTLVDLLGY